jgi:hypothetical protein
MGAFACSDICEVVWVPVFLANIPLLAFAKETGLSASIAQSS